MNRLQEIEARLAAIAKEIETRGAELTKEQLDAFTKEVNDLKSEREALKQAAEQRNNILTSIAEGREGTVVRTFPSPSPAAPAADQRGAVEGDKYGTMEYRRAFMAYALRGTPIPAEFRADAITATTDVGAVIPTTTLNTIIDKLEATGMILTLVTRTAYKGGLAIPNSSVKPTATWVTEGTTSDKQKKTTGSVTFTYYKLRCAVAVSLEVDTMALSAFESTLINNVVEAMTKALEQAIVSGDGIGKPKGILAETPADGQSIDSVAPSYADLIAAEAALPQAYENGAVWCMSKKTFMQYYGLTDETGQPIGRVNYGIVGKPERSLLGRPVVVCDYVTSYASTLEVGTIFGFLFNFKDYVLNTNYTMGIKKYEDNETDDLVTKAIMLVDGKVVDKNSLVVIKKKAAA
ncbi:phage major capsid protein [Caproiciproducens galactitolivorans]|uniref:phage major capsid protein n=1 Tax=Caproiciproducens galactitolivorans TaxID=642589 RepID=UPI00240980CB|nr:phage major capsid protein [Caproiciproducens galactitolivorans]